MENSKTLPRWQDINSTVLFTRHFFTHFCAQTTPYTENVFHMDCQHDRTSQKLS